MDEQLDVWRSALLLINQHGSGAEFVAAQRADQMIGCGNAEGEAMWKKILVAIRELQKRPPPGEARR
jgi:hypothetical protein